MDEFLKHIQQKCQVRMSVGLAVVLSEIFRDSSQLLSLVLSVCVFGMNFYLSLSHSAFVLLSQVPEHLCHGHKPRYQEPCNLVDCPAWNTGEWSGVSCNPQHLFITQVSQLSSLCLQPSHVSAESLYYRDSNQM